MSKTGFIGIGNMGGPMARNLIAAGYQLQIYDHAPDALRRMEDSGAAIMADAAAAARDAELIITMLPAGKNVRAVYDDDFFAVANPGALLIDCSTIDVDSARDVGARAAERGFDMVDAPVSGGVGGAEAATLAFMVGGPDAAFARARPVLENMGRTVVHCGAAGAGQAAKICNNMMLGIQMISVCEAFGLAEKLGLEAQKLFEVSAAASGQCWSLTTYCPVPGPVPTSPANRDYRAGFTAAMMTKDLQLARAAAATGGAHTPLGRHALELYQSYIDSGGGEQDFSGIIGMIRKADTS